MTRIFFTLLDLFFCLFCFSQESMSGVYMSNDASSTIIIYRNRFVIAGKDYREIDPIGRVFYTGTFNKIENRFIELHFPSLKEKIDSGVRITQYSTGNCKSLVMNLFTPKLKGERCKTVVSYSTENLTTGKVEGSYESGECSLVLPSDSKILSVYIYNNSFQPIISPYGLGTSKFKNGYIFYCLSDIRINEQTNILNIEIPDISQNFFTQYDINAELMKIDNGHLIWHGVVFNKSNDKEALNLIKNLETNQSDDAIERYLTKMSGIIVKSRKSFSR